MSNTQIDIQQFTEAQRRHHKGELASALRVYDVILKRNPSNMPAKAFRFLALAQLGKGLDHIDHANVLLGEIDQFQLPELIALSIFYKTIGQYNVQLNILEIAQSKYPESIVVKANLGNYYLQIGELQKAKSLFLYILDKTRDDPAASLNLARIEILSGNFTQAEEYLDRAESISPGFQDIYYLRAVVANHDCDYQAASDYLEKVIGFNIAHRDAWKIWRSLPASAIHENVFDEFCNKIEALKVTDPAILLSAYAICRQSLFWNNIYSLEGMLEKALEGNPDFAADATMVFTSLQTNLSPDKVRHVARQSWKLSAQRNEPDYDVKFASKNCDNQKLRIGYLSSDLRDHVVSRIITCVLESHNKTSFEIYAYSNFGSDGSLLRGRLNDCIDQWVNIATLDDVQLANKIRADKIDVLIDLNGITRGTRVNVFRYRAAPVQITWLGMPGTLGAGRDCDYIIVDDIIVDEINVNDGFDEKLVKLNPSYVPVDKEVILPNSLTRADFGIPPDKFVFSTFCTAQKYHPTIIDCWIDILEKSPNSVILFLDHGFEINKRIEALFEARQIKSDRLIFLDSLEHAMHLERLSFVDCALETWPYGAGGTCVDVIRAGVPIVTLKGNQFHTRVGSSISNAAGLSELIAENIAEYVRKAVSVYHLNDKAYFKQKIKLSGVYDTLSFVKKIEEIYRKVYSDSPFVTIQ